MAQEFTIKSENIETKINQLLPSQGGFGAGIDFSASTMVVPIVDLTETAEGSVLRQDLQSALSHDSVTSFNVVNTTTTILNTTGYYRVFGAISQNDDGSSAQTHFLLNDGTTDKIILDAKVAVRFTSSGNIPGFPFDFIVQLKAGDSLKAVSGSTFITIAGCTRQLADINGNLVNP